MDFVDKSNNDNENPGDELGDVDCIEQDTKQLSIEKIVNLEPVNVIYSPIQSLQFNCANLQIKSANLQIKSAGVVANTSKSKVHGPPPNKEYLPPDQKCSNTHQAGLTHML